MLKPILIGLAVALGVAALANGVFMLTSPEGWYFAVPGVTTTGSFNQHFIRDIGIVFLFIGAGFLTGAFQPHLRLFAWATPTIWLSGHALFHFWEVAVGICTASVLGRDFPAVTLPALLGWLLTVWALKRARIDGMR